MYFQVEDFWQKSKVSCLSVRSFRRITDKLSNYVMTRQKQINAKKLMFSNTEHNTGMSNLQPRQVHLFPFKSTL